MTHIHLTRHNGHGYQIVIRLRADRPGFIVYERSGFRSRWSAEINAKQFLNGVWRDK